MPEGAFCAASAPRQQFHNVSINKAACDYFLANGRFPGRTVLVMQVFEAAEKEPRSVLASGVFNGRRVGLEVAVTNTSRPDGNATPWACYNFTDPSDRSKVLRRRLHIPMKSARIAISVVRASIMFRFNFIRLCETEGRSS
jgi:hypothetical protein